MKIDIKQNNISFTNSHSFRIMADKFARYGITESECIEGVNSAADFFGLPHVEILDDTEACKEGTCVYTGNPSLATDDKLYYNLEELQKLNITGKNAFTLIMTHECSHRVFQRPAYKRFLNGRWEEELGCDFFMGVRAGLNFMDTKIVSEGLGSTEGWLTHPVGYLRSEFIRLGECHGLMNAVNRSAPRFDKYMDYLAEDLSRYQDRIDYERAKLYHKLGY